MKTTILLLRTALFAAFLLFTFPQAQGQLLKKLGKRAERAAERTVERRVEQETAEKTDQVLDSILEPGSKGPEKPPSPNPDTSPSDGDQGGSPSTGQGGNNSGQDGGSAGQGTGSSGPQSLQVYSKFDFVPGDEVLFFDDFSKDFIGDFPSKWNTNGSGEVVTLGEGDERWLEMISGYNVYYLPNIGALPEEYTIEFDLEAIGLDRKTSSTAHLSIILSEDELFGKGGDYIEVEVPFCQYSAVGITVEGRDDGDRKIRSTVRADLRDEVLNRPHVSIAVNTQRFRLWVNEEKHVDIPRLLPPGNTANHLKLLINNFKDGTERLFIGNLKIAKGGLDLRRTLMEEGKVSTNGILFDSGSANIKAESMGVIRQIYQVLQQDSNISLQIVGHTDSDGETASNQKLSESRAQAVKDALVSVYGVDAGRLSTLGKGESEPIAENNSPADKAKNRRVEFIKQ